MDIIGVGKITKKIVREVIALTVINNKSGPKTYFLKDKEAYTVATSEIDGTHGLPRDILSLTNELQKLIHELGKRSIDNGIQPKSAQIYVHRVIE